MPRRDHSCDPTGLRAGSPCQLNQRAIANSPDMRTIRTSINKPHLANGDVHSAERELDDHMTSGKTF